MIVPDLINGVLSGSRSSLARAITLIESSALKHTAPAREILNAILPYSGKSVRVGVTGMPGAGKSSFIEAFGEYLCDKGKKVAVLAIDPSSKLSRGSILGDKTRMENLSRNENAFIRPSPTSGTLGGVARKTRESMLLCEAAGFDVILIETVGIGQSETTVRSMCDFFLLMLLPSGGDELQGIKKGSVELADAILINKSDGENLHSARITKNEYENALHILPPITEGWHSRVMNVSALLGEGIAEVWSMVEDFIAITQKNEVFSRRRQYQALEWFRSMIEEGLKKRFYENELILSKIGETESGILAGTLAPSFSAEELLDKFFGNRE